MADRHNSNPTAGFDHSKQRMRGSSKPAITNLANGSEQTSTIKYGAINPELVQLANKDFTQMKLDPTEDSWIAIMMNGGKQKLYTPELNLNFDPLVVVCRVDEYDGATGHCEFKGWFEGDAIPNALEYVDPKVKSFSHQIITEYRTYKGVLNQKPEINQLIRVRVPDRTNPRIPGFILGATNEYMGVSIKSAKIPGDTKNAALAPAWCAQISTCGADSLGSGVKNGSNQVAKKENQPLESQVNDMLAESKADEEAFPL
jgi:hypothetical protein